MNPIASGVKGRAAPSPSPARRIPFAFRADPVALDGLGLDPTARAAFVLILDNAKDRGWKSRLSNATIGRVLGRCPMTISRVLGRLEAAGLVRRELAAGGRIRLAILVTWEGVADPRLTEQAALRREHPRGSAPASKGLGAAVEQTSPPIQGENQTSPILSTGGEDDPEAAAMYAALGPAGFFRAMIRKGLEEAEAKRAARPSAPAPAQPPPPPEVPKARQVAAPAPPAPSPVPIADRRATARPAAPSMATPPTSAGTVAPPAPASVTGMVRGLADLLRAPDLGPRRVGPARLARQLEEMRRRHRRE